MLELGCGRGEYTTGLASIFSEKKLIGVDIKGDRIWYGSKQAIALGLDNVAFLEQAYTHLQTFSNPMKLVKYGLLSQTHDHAKGRQKED